MPFASLPLHDPVRAIAKRVMWLVGIFFGLCVVFWVLAVIADMQRPGEITIYLWGRVVTELILGIAFFLFVFLWRRGKFWGYLRMLMTSALALVSALSVVILVGEYPWWLRLEQAVQALIPVALLILLSRPVIRQQFTKKSSS